MSTHPPHPPPPSEDTGKGRGPHAVCSIPLLLFGSWQNFHIHLFLLLLRGLRLVYKGLLHPGVRRSVLLHVLLRVVHVFCATS